MSLSVKLKGNKQVIIVNDNQDLEHCTVVELLVSDVEDNEDDNIFSSMLTPTDDNAKVIKIVIDKNVVWVHPDKTAKFNWLMSGAATTGFVEEKFPEELVKNIKKSVNASNGIIDTRKEVIGTEEEKDIVVDFVTQNSAMFDEMIKEVYKRNDVMRKQIDKLKTMSGSLDIYSFVDRYMFKKHILIRGERGSGKTFAVDSAARTIPDCEFLFIAGSEGLDTTDLVGYYTRKEDGSVVWLDGILTEAMRIAKTKKVILMIDEMLRCKAKELNILVGTLTPSSIGTYRLKTNRITDIENGVGKGELIEVPMENLWVCATTNIGSKYNVDDMDSALADRFRIMDKGIDGSEIHHLVSKRLDNKKFDSKYADKLVELYTQVDTLFGSGELDDKLNIRHLTEVIDFASEQSEIKSYLFDLAPYVCSTDVTGNLSKTEKDIFIRLIKKIF